MIVYEKIHRLSGDKQISVLNIPSVLHQNDFIARLQNIKYQIVICHLIFFPHTAFSELATFCCLYVSCLCLLFSSAFGYKVYLVFIYLFYIFLDYYFIFIYFMVF